MVTDATTIFNGCDEERFIALRAQRKEITKAITSFVNKHRAIRDIPREQWEDMAVGEQLDDVDANRKFLIGNINNSIKLAQDTQDPFYHFDRGMLESVVGYVERARIQVAACFFFCETTEEVKLRCTIKAKDNILPRSCANLIDKRKCHDDSDDSHKPQHQKQRALDGSTAFTSYFSSADLSGVATSNGTVLPAPLKRMLPPSQRSGGLGLRAQNRASSLSIFPLARLPPSPEEVSSDADVKRAQEETKVITKETEKVRLEMHQAIKLTQEKKEQARKRVAQDKEEKRRRAVEATRLAQEELRKAGQSLRTADIKKENSRPSDPSTKRRASL